MSIVNKSDYSYVLSNKKSVVITGDSLAYNRYDFMNIPKNDAYLCYPGMKSWSFLLRDYLITNQLGFISGRELLSKFQTNVTFFCESSFMTTVPFMMDGACITLKQDESISLNTGSGYLFLLTDPINGGEVTIDQQVIETTGNKNMFLGYDIICIPVTNGVITCKVDKMRLNIIGFSTVGTMTFLTGSGSKTTKWLADNLKERVLKYKPDLLIVIIGANDRNNSTPKESHDSLQYIIKKSNCDIILLTSPHSTTSDPDNGNIYLPNPLKTKPIIDCQYNLCKENDLTLVDLFKLFSGIDSKDWRYDNVHLSRKGNKQLFTYLINELFGGSE